MLLQKILKFQSPPCDFQRAEREKLTEIQRSHNQITKAYNKFGGSLSIRKNIIIAFSLIF